MNQVRIIARKHAISKHIGVPVVTTNARNLRKNANEAKRQARLAVVAKADSVNPSAMSRDALRKLAAEKNIKGRGSMTKAELIEALT